MENVVNIKKFKTKNKATTIVHTENRIKFNPNYKAPDISQYFKDRTRHYGKMIYVYENVINSYSLNCRETELKFNVQTNNTNGNYSKNLLIFQFGDSTFVLRSGEETDISILSYCDREGEQ